MPNLSTLFKKHLLITGGITTPLVAGGVVAGVLLNKAKPKEAVKSTLKDKLIKRGFKEVKNFGAKMTLLRQYKDFPQDITNLSEWCSTNANISEKDKPDLAKQFKEFCFESIASEIENDINFAILDEDAGEWQESLNKFNKDYQPDSEQNPSSKWSDTKVLTEFKDQCRKNQREQFSKENNTLLEEVKKYCTRKRSFIN